VENFKGQGVTLCGDVLLISAFVSYVGYFTKKYRNELMEKFWIPFVNNLKVRSPVVFMTQGIWGGPWQGRRSPRLPAEAEPIQGLEMAPSCWRLTSFLAAVQSAVFSRTAQSLTAERSIIQRVIRSRHPF
jgi:hypothetical protein